MASAAVVLAIATRQVNRLLIRFREDGGGGLIDATSKLMQLRFVPSESTDSYFAALEGYVNESWLSCRVLLEILSAREKSLNFDYYFLDKYVLKP